MSRYLVTQTLISAWSWMFDCPVENAESAREDFLRVLNREPRERTEAMQNGLDFEREVYRAAAGIPRGPHETWESGIRKTAQIIQGASVQVKLSRELEQDGLCFLVYGILDALKAGMIYDIKFSSKSLGTFDAYGKYQDSAQHPFYFYLVPEAETFQYLLSDGEDLYIETYHRNDCRSAESILREFIPSLSEMGLLELYFEKWLAE